MQYEGTSDRRSEKICELELRLDEIERIVDVGKAENERLRGLLREVRDTISRGASHADEAYLLGAIDRELGDR